MSISKDKLRQRYLSIRRAIPPAIKRSNDEQIIHRLSQLLRNSRYTDVYFYFPFQAEPDLLSLPLKIGTSIGVWALPVVQSNQMRFVKWTGRERLEINQYGISEVDTSERVYLEPNEYTLLIMPAIAGTIQGYRLGYGAGYTDRFLAQYPQLDSVMVLYQECLIDTLPTESHDQVFTYVCTPETLIKTVQN